MFGGTKGQIPSLESCYLEIAKTGHFSFRQGTLCLEQKSHQPRVPEVLCPHLASLPASTPRQSWQIFVTDDLSRGGSAKRPWFPAFLIVCLCPCSELEHTRAFEHAYVSIHTHSQTPVLHGFSNMTRTDLCHMSVWFCPPSWSPLHAHAHTHMCTHTHTLTP